VATKVVIASERSGVSAELAIANGQAEVIGCVRTAAEAEVALRALQPAVLVVDPELVHRDGEGLTLRERDVVRLVSLGHTNAEVAERLSVSVRTIEKHRDRIRRRVGLARRSELVRWALDHGLVDP
jgi:two-component system response regulator NreC